MKADKVLTILTTAKPGSSFRTSLMCTDEAVASWTAYLDHYLRQGLMFLDARFERKGVQFVWFPTMLCTSQALREIAERLGPGISSIQIVEPPNDIVIQLFFPGGCRSVYSLVPKSKSIQVVVSACGRIALEEADKLDSPLRLDESEAFGRYAWDYTVGEEELILAHAEAVAKRFGVKLQMGEEKKR